MNKINRTYIVTYALFGISSTFAFIASSCNPISQSEILQITRNSINPACVLRSYDIMNSEAPSSNYPTMPINNSYVTASETTISTASPSPSLEVPDEV